MPLHPSLESDQIVQPSSGLSDPIREGLRVHGWSQFIPYGGQVLPICLCGWYGPFALSVDDCYELVCERGEDERTQAARRALVHGQ